MNETKLPPHSKLVEPSQHLYADKKYTPHDKSDIRDLFNHVRREMARQAIPDPWDELNPPQWWSGINGTKA